MIDLEFILASSSPRRIELLKSVDLNFQVIKPNINEDFPFKGIPEDFVKHLAYLKAYSVAVNHKNKFVAGFDTIVEINGKILGKPESKTEAFNMLKELSNNYHQVLTGFSIINLEKNFIIRNACITKVWFKKLSDKEINWYINTKEPFDKAGAYAIQGKGAFMVRKIEGSYTNVVGLPLTEFLDHLYRISNESM